MATASRGRRPARFQAAERLSRLLHAPDWPLMRTRALRVHALVRLDASIIPDIPSTPANLTVIMLAERIYQRVYEHYS